MRCYILGYGRSLFCFHILFESAVLHCVSKRVSAPSDASGIVTPPNSHIYAISVLKFEKIHDKCMTELEAEHVECKDFSDSGCDGAKIELIVVSKQFEGVPLLKRHQKVNELFSAELSSNQIHALTMKTWTPQQYASKK